MKKILTIAMTLLMVVNNNIFAATADTLSMTYQRFIDQKGIEKYESYFNIYKQDKRFWLEIPQEAMGRDILITCQAINGYNNYLSSASDVVTLEHHDLHTIYLRHHRSLDFQRDTLDASVMDAIRNSNLQPIDRVLNIVSLGKEGKSYIIEVTQDITTASGLFDVTKSSNLSHPDPDRSGWLGTRAINGGFSMEVYRSQTDALAQRSMNDRQDVANTTVLQLVMQCLPEHNHEMRVASPAFGFETISRQEFDSKNYLAHRRNYITSWDFTTGPISIFIDPDMPEPFKNSVRSAVSAWTSALTAAGVKKPFVYSTDQKANNLAYKCITFVWGNAANGVNSKTIVDPMTGEIMAARINLLDRNMEEFYEPYFIQCRHIDGRVKKDFKSLAMRQDVVASWVTREMGLVLGMKSNWRGKSVTGPFELNYAATAGTASPVPQIAEYDRQAMRFAYGKGGVLPAKTDYFSAEDKRDPYAQKDVLSADIIGDSRKGLENMKRSYATMLADVKALPADQINVQGISHMAVQHLTVQETCLQRVASLVGGRSKYPIIKGVSEQAVVYVPRTTQLEALDFLEKNILSGIPAWVKNEELNRICSGNMNSMSIGAANGVAKALLNADVLQSLAEQERALGAANAFTAKELIDYINRLVFADFDANKAPTDFQRKVQISTMLSVAEYVHGHNVVMGMQNEGNCILQVYLVDTAKKIADLANNHTDKETRAHYAMLKMRLDRAYFNKKIQ